MGKERREKGRPRFRGHGTGHVLRRRPVNGAACQRRFGHDGRDGAWSACRLRDKEGQIKAIIANLITGTRIICSIVLLLCPIFSPLFYILYVAAGLTDIVDGPVARKTGTANELGAKLDSAADFVFVAVCLWKLLPSLAVPLWLWIWIVLIALIKTVNLLSGYILQKRFVTMHTVMNKTTGILLFVLPLTLPAVELKYSAPLVCTAATFAAIQEGHFIRRN